MRDYMDRRVTPSKRVTSPTWGPPPPCKQALSQKYARRIYLAAMSILKLLSVFMMKGGTESFTENLGRTEIKQKSIALVYLKTDGTV